MRYGMNHYWIPGIATLALMFTLAACDTTTVEPELSEEEAEAVAGVMADALSDRSDGMMAGLHDLTASVSRDGLSYSSSAAKNGGRDWRGAHRSFSAEYDSTTGEHVIQYRREVDRPNVYKKVGVNLTYVFEDVDGNVLAFPRRAYDDIATIIFDGRRAGETNITRPRGSRASTLDRDAQWVLSGLEDGTPTMSLNGTQTHVGTQRVDRGGSVATREYSMRLNVVDVTIRKPTEDDEPLEERISGTLEYQATVKRTIDGEERENTYRGTVELDGAGAARLRLMGFRHPFFINLANGDVDDA